MMQAPQQTEEQIIKLVFNDATYHLKPDVLYRLIKPLVDMLLMGGASKGDTPEQKRVAQIFKTGVKGLFIMGGDTLLTMIFQSKDHPKPSKNDDVLAWYSDILAMVAIKHITTQTIHVETVPVEGLDDAHEITGYTSKSV